MLFLYRFRWPIRLIATICLFFFIWFSDRVLSNEALLFLHYHLNNVFENLLGVWQYIGIPEFPLFQQIILLIIYAGVVTLAELTLRLVTGIIKRIYYSLNGLLVYPFLILPVIVALSTFYFTIAIYPQLIGFEQIALFTILATVATILSGLLLVSLDLENGCSSTYYQHPYPDKEREYQDISTCPNVEITADNLDEATETNRYLFNESQRITKLTRRTDCKLAHYDTRDVHYTVEVYAGSIFVAYSTGFLDEVGGAKKLMRRISRDILEHSSRRASSWSSALLSPEILAMFSDSFKHSNWTFEVKYEVYNGDRYSHSYTRTETSVLMPLLIFVFIVVCALPIGIAALVQWLLLKLHSHMQLNKARRIADTIADPVIISETIANPELAEPEAV